MVINAYQTAAEGKNLAKGYQNGMVDFTQRLGNEAAGEQCAPEGAHRYRYY